MLVLSRLFRRGIVIARRVLFLVVIVCGACTASATELKVMSFNIHGMDFSVNDPDAWFYYPNGFNPNDPTSGGPHRRDRVYQVIRDFAPDIWAVQELHQAQQPLIEADLPEYEYYGVGRDGGGNGDRNGIFYRSDRFDLLDTGEFWLSETPDVPGTTFPGFDDTNHRMVSWVKLHDREASRDYFVFGTHWSLDTTAERRSAELIRQRLEGITGGLPTLFLGDLNATAGETSVRTLRGVGDPDGPFLRDAYADLGLTEGRTYHANSGGISGSRIDHILYTQPHFVPLTASIVRSTPGGRFPSDHYPVTATFMIIPEPSSLVLGLLGAVAIVSSRRRVLRRANR
jgi:endonuclease/exonuclease/phosphatase family metal-dependent hydrolase